MNLCGWNASQILSPMELLEPFGCCVFVVKVGMQIFALRCFPNGDETPANRICVAVDCDVNPPGLGSFKLVLRT